ncbi:MAG TPA: SIR2 family protein [Zoogloea sp.]|uniref:SIR2 family protein n=1 Tax=Zoogloea sp. TaxID=49181 RepID=UPI002B536D97|nr:SIR2 family protein [Zoogloea sp.]HMV17372.1 SIR2 family protein [Rhodocyclaceae bacterium]HMV64938.1 SIR2 family protein [Rhodocyclaceae bacterium]HMW53745.1 SIR2 family protein [Rhodocyclaceae bacterium]HMZ77792.1 SIR2 family protein [Rhodocyclaceae bacterium]HNA69276.1 SIR2 family protein [Rhodocyclaceae bacterium]
MTPELRATLLAGIQDGSIVPYLGAGVLADVKNVATGEPIPATSDALIIAMNGGKPMAPKLMYEFPRAAMNVELKRGRSTVNKFLTRTYGETQWTRGAVHDWIKAIRPRYVIDINRDTQLQDSYADVPHNLIVGIARIGGTTLRYKIFFWDGSSYQRAEELKLEHPILFKPVGTPRPEPTYIASDADYVDFITELMGGFSIPPQLKEFRKGKQYLLAGLRLNRDTERMVMADIIYSAAEPAGWVFIAEPTDKERRYCKKIGLEIVDADIFDLIGEPQPA